MSPYHNLPFNQRFVQSIVDKFNDDEKLWQSLLMFRRRRRKNVRNLPKKLQKNSDKIIGAIYDRSPDHESSLLLYGRSFSFNVDFKVTVYVVIVAVYVNPCLERALVVCSGIWANCLL